MLRKKKGEEMKVILLPFGSYRVSESRDQDFVAIPQNRDTPEELVKEAVVIDAASLDRDQLVQAARNTGFDNPDIWIFNQDGDMKPIIVANLIKDYPYAADFIQQAMGLRIDIQAGDVVLIEAMEKNVKRWNEAPPHLLNLRKRVFSRIQKEAYEQGFGFFNTKSEIDQVAETMLDIPTGMVKDFLLGETEITAAYEEEVSALRILGLSEKVVTYQSKHGAIFEIPELTDKDWGRICFTPLEEKNGKFFVYWEEVYTYHTYIGVIELDEEVWEMLVNIDLEEIK